MNRISSSIAHFVAAIGFILVLNAGPSLQTETFATTSEETPAFSIRSPYRSLARTSQFLNMAAMKILLLQDYKEQTSEEGDWKVDALSDVAAVRRFLKDLGRDTRRTVELIVAEYPGRGYEIYVYGLERRTDGERPNPDLREIRTDLEALVQAIQEERQSLDVEDLAFEVYHLSYLQSDRALAVLKSLGYTTVEYTQQDGETLYDKIYAPVLSARWHLPAIIKFIDATKTSLMDPSPIEPPQQAKQAQGKAQAPVYSAVPDIGGTFLHQMTSGEPQQRLLIAYDLDDPEPMEILLNLLRERIDLPARQIVIEALIIEVNIDRLKDLGISFRAAEDNYEVSFEESDAGAMLPFTLAFEKNAFGDILSLRSRLKALIDEGEGEILSNPSVLVLDGRQARIQVGQQVPVVRSTATAAGITSSVEYFPVGIVLNLRPRVSEDGSEITMQVETIVSSISRAVSTQTEASQVFFAPTVDNRQVQTFVRVADNTPFIIGGLISTDKQERTAGIPFLSRIPILGLLFRRKVTENTKMEVIVVLTPHVVPTEERSFSYVIPKDSERFDSFGNRLFRNAYRIRDDDIFDLAFIYESQVFRDLLAGIRARSEEQPGLRNAAPFSALLNGGVPGEEILVRRMLWEVVRKTDYARHIDMDRVIFFEDRPDAPDSTGFRLTWLNRKLAERGEGQNTLVLGFDARSRGTSEHPFSQPKAAVSYERLTSETYSTRLMQGNRPVPDGLPDRWTILLTDAYSGTAHPIDVLKGVLVLKRILFLNSTLPLTIQDFHVGRQIIFPAEQDLQSRFHIIDRDAARFFYEVTHYYPAFEQAFNRETRRAIRLMDAFER